MVFNVSGGTGFSDIFIAANSSTNNLMGIVLLILVYVITYVAANRSGFDKAIVPSSMIGFVCAIFFFIMSIISGEILILTLFIFAGVTAFTWGR